MKINILLCDTFPELLPENIPSYSYLFKKLFTSVDSTVTYDVFNVQQGVYPDKLNENELYLISGSNANVYQNMHWINELKNFIRIMYMNNVKMLGICFGHQAIAEALGGKVERAVQGWGAGVRSSDIVIEHFFDYFPEKKMRLLYNHHCQVVKLPDRAACLATSGFCRYDAFLIDNKVLAFQGHPEYTSAYSRHLLEQHAGNEDVKVVAEALNTLHIEIDSYTVARLILNWLEGKVDL